MLPATKNGAPIVSSIEIPITFGLNNDNHSIHKTPARMDNNYPLNLDKFYPVPLRDLGEQGSCIVNAHVKANGVVREAKIVKTTGFATLDDACIKAALSIWFIPATEDGKPVESWVLQPITWAIRGTKQPEIDPAYKLKVGDAYYPETSRALHEEGDCIVAIFVSEDGTLVNARLDASSGFPMLDQASLSAVKEAKFTPGIKNGTPAALPGYIVISWRLSP
jgi:protein TonB